MKEKRKNTGLGELRRRQAISQRTFAERSSISRGRLRRLEGGQFEQATLEEFKRMAFALGIEPAELLTATDSLHEGSLISKAGETSFQIGEASAGFRIRSFFLPQRDIFAGKMFISSQCTVPSGKTPRCKLTFLQMLLGKLKVITSSQTHELCEGDCLLFLSAMPYSLKNSLRREAIVLLVTVPGISPR